MIETIFLAFLLAKFKSFRLKPIFKNYIFYPLFVSSLIYIIMEICIFNGVYTIIIYTYAYKFIFILSLFIIVIKYGLYKPSIIGSIFVLLGSLLNKIAINNNNGKMPVFLSLSKYTGYAKLDSIKKINDIHTTGTSATKLKFLTDIFDIGYNIMSIGDILIRVSVFLIIYKAIESENNITTY